jgi:hypothetical protein
MRPTSEGVWACEPRQQPNHGTDMLDLNLGTHAWQWGRLFQAEATHGARQQPDPASNPHKQSATHTNHHQGWGWGAAQQTH